MVRDNRQGIRLCVDVLENREVPALVDFNHLAVDASSFDADHILVKWRDGVYHATTFTQSAEALGNGLFRITLKEPFTVNQALSTLSTSSAIAIAQPDYRVTINATPDDVTFGSLWGLNNSGQNGGTVDADIDAPEAWNTSTGTKRTVVAVIDTGVDFNHPDLARNIWHNTDEIPGNGIDDDRNGFKDDYYGYDFANNDYNPMDDNGHGTHVAGTIGAVGDNGIGVAGVNWNTQIMALKFLDRNGSGYLSNAVRALNYAVANGAKVVNASFGGGGYDAAMATAINNARAKGVIVVAAAGNDGTNNDVNPVYPANYSSDNLIAVAATDRNDRIASFSNYGRVNVDLGAPGVSIYSTLPGNKYGSYSGTSMAAPHVTGAISLVWDAHPTWTYRQVLDAVLNTTDSIASLSGKAAHGRLNVARAIAYGGTTTTPTPPKDITGATVTDVKFNGSGSTISQARVTFSEAINPTTFTATDVTLMGPGGTKIAVGTIKAVAGMGNTQFDVTFAAQSKAGTYILAVGPDVRDAAGNPMDQNRNGRTGESNDKFTTTAVVSSAQTFASADVGKPILDFVPIVSKLTITKDIAIGDLNVKVNASHTYVGDVRMTLITPDGTRVVLVNRRGGSGNDFSNTVFDDEGAGSIYAGQAPFAGSFKPEYQLKAFDGKSAKGTWQLVVEDTGLFDYGRLNAWSLTIEGTTKAAAANARPARPQAVAQTSLPSAPPVDRNGQVYLGLSSYFVRLQG